MRRPKASTTRCGAACARSPKPSCCCGGWRACRARTAATIRPKRASATIPIERNTVYVIPPRHGLKVVAGRLELNGPPSERGRHVAVDLFFRTLADTHGPRAAAVVLSGADGDGAIGIKRIKERGGLTIAQDPDEAE